MRERAAGARGGAEWSRFLLSVGTDDVTDAAAVVAVGSLKKMVGKHGLGGWRVMQARQRLLRGTRRDLGYCRFRQVCRSEQIGTSKHDGTGWERYYKTVKWYE